jgi:hypothetical protein
LKKAEEARRLLKTIISTSRMNKTSKLRILERVSRILQSLRTTTRIRITTRTRAITRTRIKRILVTQVRINMEATTNMIIKVQISMTTTLLSK